MLRESVGTAAMVVVLVSDWVGWLLYWLLVLLFVPLCACAPALPPLPCSAALLRRRGSAALLAAPPGLCASRSNLAFAAARLRR